MSNKGFAMDHKAKKNAKHFGHNYWQELAARLLREMRGR